MSKMALVGCGRQPGKIALLDVGNPKIGVPLALGGPPREVLDRLSNRPQKGSRWLPKTSRLLTLLL